MTNPSVDPLVGRTVAHYEIVSRLSGGGMGVVYRAIDRKLGRDVAVKFLPPQWSHDETAKQRFIREAQAASATHHPNICTIHDIETADDGQLFIVMAYYEGPTLKQRLESGPLPMEEALDIATQIADGLAKAHAQGVVHRDVKPGNLILTEDGVRIVDFGLATFVDALQLTSAGSTLGTAAYMSPEQSRGEDADARTDVWAAGVVLYEMLAGRVPFRGSYAEAIAYAIRNDPPPPLRTDRSEIPEAVEQLVFRALHQDPVVRFQSGRELARALRQVRGFTVPQDLRTQVVTTPAIAPAPVPVRRAGRRRMVIAAAVVALLAGTPAWLFIPVDRVTVAVMPVVNGTGFSPLGGFEFALLEEMAAALRDSRSVKAVMPDRVREILRAFRVKGEASGPEAIQAIADYTRADVLLLPMLVYGDGEWRARVVVRNPRAAGEDRLLTAGPAEASALLTETAYDLTLQLALVVEDYVAERGPARGYLLHRVRKWMSRNRAAERRLGTLEAAAAFERGLDAYDRMEYTSAWAAFTEATERQPHNPLLEAWRSRAALVMRRDADARSSAERAAPMPADWLPIAERRFIEAVVAEARGDFLKADAAYAALVAADEENPAWLIEQAGYFDRRAQYAEAEGVYLRALDLDGELARPELELCRLYAPTRLNEPVKAKEQADKAAKKYRDIGSRIGEAQAAMCRADTLRVGGPENWREGSRNAGEARAILEAADAPYQFPRALYYVAIAAFAEQRFPEAAKVNEEALEAARRAGNVALEPFILQNLGATHLRLGHRRQHIEHTRASADLFAARGEDERAAGLQANAGAALIDFGEDPTEGFRLVENALKVSQKSRNTDGEMFALQVMAAYHRYGGRYSEAQALLGQALALARRSGQKQTIWSIQLDQSRLLFELGDFVAARDLVVSGMEATAERGRTQAEIWLAQIETRLGDFDAARARLIAASSLVDASDAVTRLLLQTAQGELEYESDHALAARTAFRAAARSWGDELPHARSVEAVAYAGLLDALMGNVAGGVAAVQRSLVRARLTGRAAMETRCRVFLARIAIVQRHFDEALRLLNDVPADDRKRAVGPELRAQVHYWTGQALKGRGDAAGGDAEIGAARKALQPIHGRLPADAQARFRARVDVRRILE